MTDLITTEMFYNIVIESQVYANKYDAQNVADSLNSQINEKIQPLIDAHKELVEVYAGLEGFIPETAPEAYQSRIIEQMYGIAKTALEEYRSE